MNITVVTASMGAGGAERVIAQLLKEWCANGVECTLITLNKAPIFYPLPKQVEVLEIGVLSKKHYIDKLKKYVQVRKLIRKIKPDIVLALPEEIGIYVIGALLGMNVPVVVSERNNPWKMPYKKASRIVRKLMYPFAEGFIFQTSFAASFFPESIQRRGIVLKNPLDLARIPNPYEGTREKIIVGAGRLEPQKNFKLLIDAFSLFYKKHSNYKLVIYGEGTMRNELETYAAVRIPQDAYAFPGNVSNLLDRINSCSAFVLSSDYEGMPNVLIEAMAMGVPCVSTDCPSGGPKELIKDGINGFLVEVGDRDTLVQRLDTLVSGVGIYSEAQQIKEHFNSKRIANQWLAYLKSVINRG